MRITKREKIIKYLKENCIDILPLECTSYCEERYKKTGTILIEKPHDYNGFQTFHKIIDLCTYNSPIDTETPYHKDCFGNTTYFERNKSYIRICWKK